MVICICSVSWFWFSWSLSGLIAPRCLQPLYRLQVSIAMASSSSHGRPSDSQEPRTRGRRGGKRHRGDGQGHVTPMQRTGQWAIAPDYVLHERGIFSVCFFIITLNLVVDIDHYFEVCFLWISDIDFLWCGFLII